MSLSQQFQIIIFSFLFGIFFLAVYDLFNRLFYKIKGKFVRFVFELILFSLLSTIYFFILFVINDAVLTIYLPLSLIIGGLFYFKFLSFPLLKLYESIIKSIKNKFRPYYLSILKKFAIMKEKRKERRRKLHEKIAKFKSKKAIKRKEN